MKNEMDAQLGVVELVKDDERCAGNRIGAQTVRRIRSFGIRIDGQEMLKDAVKEAALFSSNTYTECLFAEFQKFNQLPIEGFRRPDLSHAGRASCRSGSTAVCQFGLDEGPGLLQCRRSAILKIGLRLFDQLQLAWC